MTPIVVPGSVQIEAITGTVTEDYFILYVTTKEKYGVIVDTWMENPAVVSLRCNESEPQTHLYFPSGWSVEASFAKYTCRILGVKNVTEKLHPIDYALVHTEEEAFQKVEEPTTLPTDWIASIYCEEGHAVWRGTQSSLHLFEESCCPQCDPVLETPMFTQWDPSSS